MLTPEVLEQYQKLRAKWRQDPVLYCRQRLGLNPTRQQAKILEAIAPSGSKVTVRAGHGIGKSGSTSGAIWWHMECFDYSKTPCTAPTRSQLEQILWSEISKWQRKSDIQSKKNGLPPELYLSSLFDFTATRVTDKGKPNEWFAVAKTSRRENPDALQGYHASDVTITDDDEIIINNKDAGSLLFVIEEASGVPDEIFQVAEGALTSHNVRLLMIGNPTKNTGFFADSHKRHRSSYTSLHFRCDESPLVDKSYRPNLVKKYGEDSNIVRVRADGEFPKQDDDVLISLEVAEQCIDREPRTTSAKRRLGIDVARFGSDRSVLIVRRGPNVERVEIRAKMNTEDLAGLAIQMADAEDIEEIFVDAAGVGGGVVDKLKRVMEDRKAEGKKCQWIVVEVQVAEKDPEKDSREAAAQTGEKANTLEMIPYRMRDFLWLEAKRWLENEEPSFSMLDRDVADDLAAELSLPKYKFRDGLVMIESKDEMKKRLTMSPDLADALNVTFGVPKPERMPSVRII